MALVLALVMVRASAPRAAPAHFPPRCQGLLTLFSFLLDGAFINPVATTVEALAGTLRPRRWLALGAREAGDGWGSLARPLHGPLTPAVQCWWSW